MEKIQLKPLTQNELQVLQNAINNTSSRENLSAYLDEHKNVSIIELLKSNPNIINFLPRDIISMYEFEIIANLNDILGSCHIKDTQLILHLMSNTPKHVYLTSDEKINVIQHADDLVTLHMKLPIDFGLEYILNYAPKPLPEFFLMGVDLVPNVREKFFIRETLTKDVAKKLFLSQKYSPALDYFYKAVVTGKVKADKKAVPVLAKVISKECLATYFDLNTKLIYDILSHSKANSDDKTLMAILTKQNINNILLKLYFSDEHLHHYLAFNKYATDDVILKHYTRRNNRINWPFVIKNINLSTHLEFTKQLISENKQDMILVSLEDTLDKGDKIHNLSELSKLNIDLSSIKEKIAATFSDLEISLC